MISTQPKRTSRFHQHFAAYTLSMMVFAGQLGLGSERALAQSDTTQNTAQPRTSATTDRMSLDDLLKNVQRESGRQKAELRKREAAFRANRDQQQRLLKEAQTELAKEEQRSQRLANTFEQGEKDLAELSERLRLSMGNFGELFGVVRQVAADTRSVFENSPVTTQYPERIAFVDELAARKALPQTRDIEKLWIELLREMTESGKTTSYTTAVTDISGQEQQQRVQRIGTFNVVQGATFLRYDSQTGKLVELGRQPAPRFQNMAAALSQADPGAIVPMAIDPSRGAILSLLVQSPSLVERVQQGGVIGYIILGLLALGLALVFQRLISLSLLERKVHQQLKSNDILSKNPLGEILAVFKNHPSLNLENLQLKLDEAILKSSSHIERGLSTIKVLAGSAPLLGLLGTVTGMIGTFQSITLFGTGDPKLMAGGISQALVTTVLGLVAAIPLMVAHSFVSGKSKRLIDILEEQSLGLLAGRFEGPSSLDQSDQAGPRGTTTQPVGG